jgi:uncharacterized protein YcbX
MIRISGLFIYPIKSCRGIPVETAEIGSRGFLHDREFLVVDEANAFVTQRTVPRLALVETAIEDGYLKLRAPHGSDFQLPLLGNASRPVNRRTVTIFSDTVIADEAGDEAAAWFSAALDGRYRLVRIGASYERAVPPGNIRAEHRATTTKPDVPFTDGFPTLITSEGTLADLNSRLPAALPMNRFRPNIVVQGGAPYDEHNWSLVRAGGVTFKSATPCMRCVITTIDQQTGARDGNEPLRTLATYRRGADGNGVMFGEYLIHEGRGTLRVGDPLVVERFANS